MTSIPNLARELVATLVHLKEVKTGVPQHGHPGYEAIRADYATTHSDGSNGDPMLNAAQKWVESKLRELKGDPAKEDADPEPIFTPVEPSLLPPGDLPVSEPSPDPALLPEHKEGE